MKKTIITATASAIVLCSSFMASAQTNDSGEYDRQRKEPTSEKASILNAEIKAEHRGYNNIKKYQIYDVQFSNWEPNHLHWNAPSNITIHSEGSWFIYAKHLANMRRLTVIGDDGAYYTALVNVTYFSGPLNAQQQCTGTAVHSNDYVLAGLGYKDELWDVTARGTDQELAKVAGQVRCASFTRWWR